MNPAQHQIDSIQSMLMRGQRPLRIHRHTLLLWGGAAGWLCAATDPLIRALQLTAPWQFGLAVLLILALVFVPVACLDRLLTLRFVRRHDLTIPFAQQQITKIWWLLVAIAIVLTSGIVMTGDGRLVYCFWIAIFGVGLFIHGAFSEELPEWVGAGMLLLGIVPIALEVPVAETRWLAVCAFGIGLPVLGLMLDGGRRMHFIKRLGQSLLWLAAVLAPALTIYHARSSGEEASALAALPAASAPLRHGHYLLTLPAGAMVPLTVSIDGPYAAAEPIEPIQLRLTRPVEIEMQGGEPTGRYRYGDDWLGFHETFRISSLVFRTGLDAHGAPALHAVIRYDTERRQ